MIKLEKGRRTVQARPARRRAAAFPCLMQGGGMAEELGDLFQALSLASPPS
ncbi:MAG: hypothetical protein IJD65_03860 [Mailhella sp.]|nr:hypothetical protein [Mailhella sp.]